MIIFVALSLKKGVIMEIMKQADRNKVNLFN